MNKKLAVFLAVIGISAGFVAYAPAGTWNSTNGSGILQQDGDTLSAPRNSSQSYRVTKIQVIPGEGDKKYNLYVGDSTTSGQRLFSASSKSPVPVAIVNTTGTISAIYTSSTAVQTIPTDFVLPPSVVLGTDDTYTTGWYTTPTLILYTVPESQ